MASVMRRLYREEEGYSLVIAILMLAVMMVLLVVSLDAGSASLRQSSLSLEWSKTLTVAEAGLDDSVTRLGESSTAANSCSISTSTVCTGGGGEYQVSWTRSGGKIVVTSIGYYPSKTAPRYTREIQATYEPIPEFRYAIFSKASLDVKNNMTIAGDIYSDGDITIENNATVCGSIISSAGGVSLSNGDQILKADSSTECSGKSGTVWTGGPGGISGGGVIEGDAIAGAPSAVTCSTSSSSYAIVGGSLDGAAKACGKISGVSGATSITPGVATSQPAPVPFPTFLFDPNNYSSAPADPLHLQCFPSGGTCGTTQSSTAVADFNAYVATHKSSLTGTFAIWQSNPQGMSGCSSAVCLDGITLSGDLTIVTNAPVDFGNTSTVTTTSSSVSADMVVVSTYQPASGTTCTNNGGDCSIYGKNAISFDGGDISNPDDGVVGLLYTPGKMGFKNSGSGEGSLYAGSMDLKNSYDLVYNSRVERVLGFGAAYERTLWQELNV